MPATTQRKKEGFQGQKAIVIPRRILTARCVKSEITGTLYVTDIGYYPKARYHYRDRPHGAEQHILIHCIEGRGSVTVGGQQFSIEAGEYFMVPMKAGHRYAADETDPWTIYWIHFKGKVSDAVTELLKKQLNGYKGFLKHGEQCIGLFNEIYQELERGYGNDHLTYANMCLWHYLTNFIYNSKFSAPGRLPQHDITDKAIDFMSRRIEKVLSLEEIARSVNLSPSHFSFLFKKKTGFAPIEYFNHLKVQKACQYLLFTDLRIKEIAFELGIEDQFYFSRLFSKVMGLSPNVYREKRIH